MLAEDRTVWVWDGPAAPPGGPAEDWQPPLPVPGLADIIAIAVGDDYRLTNGHTLALQADGTVWAWGENGSGQLGDDTRLARDTPSPVAGLQDAVAIAAGNRFSLALLADGTVRAWGSGGGGRLGQGAQWTSLSPGAVSGLGDIVAVSAASRHSLALARNGRVWTWGEIRSRSGGMIALTPMPVEGIEHVVAVAAGPNHDLALTVDGRVWAWGENEYGELGNGTLHALAGEPRPVFGLHSIVAIAAGDHHSLALRADGTLWSWGSNYVGELGLGPTKQVWRSSPERVAILDKITGIAAHGTVSVAVADLPTQVSPGH